MNSIERIDVVLEQAEELKGSDPAQAFSLLHGEIDRCAPHSPYADRAEQLRLHKRFPDTKTVEGMAAIVRAIRVEFEAGIRDEAG